MESKELSVPSEQAGGQQLPHNIKLSAALTALKNNFALVSTAALSISVSLATIFLSAYLSVFDWHLMWFVQYTDIITFGLLALGILSGSITLLEGFVQGIASGKTHQQRRNGLVIVVLLASAGTALAIWNAAHKGEGYSHFIYGGLAIGLGMALVFFAVNIVEDRMLPSAGICFRLLMLLVFFAASVGQWLGHNVSDTSEFNQDIALKDKDPMLTDAKLIIVMSRHTVLTKDGALYVLPTSDITKFQKPAKQAKPR